LDSTPLFEIKKEGISRCAAGVWGKVEKKGRKIERIKNCPGKF
jgi:hypothetical protein